MLKVEIDIAAEKLRLIKEVEKHTKEIDKMRVKLDNPNYALRAPEGLVSKDKVRVDELNSVVSQLKARLEKLV